jgi:hypothetical protein
VLFLNGIVVAVFLLAGIVFFFLMVKNSPVKALSQENQTLKKELERLREQTYGDREKSKEVRRIEALVKDLQPRLGPAVAEPVARAVAEHAHTYTIPPELILSIIYYQSAFEIVTMGDRGTVGLMQLSPKVYRGSLEQMGISENEAFHIDNNIELGCRLLRQFLDQGLSIETAIVRLVDNDRQVDKILVGFTNSMIAEKKAAARETGSEARPSKTSDTSRN